MAIEIKELVIKTTIEDKPKEGLVGEDEIKNLKSSIIDACVNEIMNRLKQQRER